MDNYKKEISKKEYYMLVGLVELAHQAYQTMKKIDEAMVEILDYENEFSGDTAGLLSDEYFENYPDVKKCLKAMGIKVK